MFQSRFSDGRFPSSTTFQGDNRQLLLALDIGTTFSGVAYSILEPGRVPEIRPVTRFPSQETVGGDIKVPTVIYYDSYGQPVSIGAETLKQGIEVHAKEKGWSKAYWFKLHLRPDIRYPEPIPPLPPNKNVVQVLADYMRYLRLCAKIYIDQTHPERPWAALKDSIIYVMTHPNGWEGAQQSQMRRAAVSGGFISDTEDGHSRIHFVTEGEASLHFCVSSGLLSMEAKDHGSVVVVDAGGGTVDVTAYQRHPGEKRFQEMTIPRCYFQGSVFVTSRAGTYFANKFRRTRFQQDIPTLITNFDRRTKHAFRRSDEPYYIEFASVREQDDELDVRMGRLTLRGETVSQFFEPSITCIINAIRLQMETSSQRIKTVFLVGGFSASDWLYERVKSAIEPYGANVSRPDSHINKAVVNGAASYYLNDLVNCRVSRMTYGTEALTIYDKSNPEHLQRKNLAEKWYDKLALNTFSIILAKGTSVRETKEFRRKYSRYSRDPNGRKLNEMQAVIIGYVGDYPNPRWLDEDPDMYRNIGIVEADTSSVPRERQKISGYDKEVYMIQFDIVLLFGLTELKAQVVYFTTVQGTRVERRTPATLVYQSEVAFVPVSRGAYYPLLSPYE